MTKSKEITMRVSEEDHRLLREYAEHRSHEDPDRYYYSGRGANVAAVVRDLIAQHVPGFGR